jgi:DNA polymerase-1
MVAIDRWLIATGARARLIMQVHDELVFEVPVQEAEAVRAEACRLMTGAASLDVPLEVDAGTGANWDEAH